MKRMNIVNLKKDGWELTPESASLLAARKEKAALNTSVLLIKQELQINNNLIHEFGNKIDNLEKSTKKISEVLEKLVKMASDISEKNNKRAWRFEVRRDSSGNIKEITAQQVI